MKTLSASAARARLFRLIDETAVGQRNSAVLISEDDWNAIQQTLYLSSILGMKSIIEGSQTPVEECIRLKDLHL